ncbi:PLC-like phosphodiesterase [Xylariaceae sp. FL0804]|nr:PLC-like phosphodiesterase [Xylariaceae sp. FL0804]
MALAGSDESLGQLALQQLMQDSIEVFGVPGSGNRSSNAEWMSHLPDAMPVAHMNIPGTHDAATWNYSQATQDDLAYATRCDNTTIAPATTFRCQDVSLAAMLEAGVRFFDLRFALDPLGARLVFWHSAALVSARTSVADVMFGFYRWLDAHPREMLILSFQWETGTVAGAAYDVHVQEALYDVFTSDAAMRYIHQDRGVVKTLGDYRGRILLFKRFDLSDLPPEREARVPGLHMSPSQWEVNGIDFELVYNQTTNATAFIEDYYYPTPYTTPQANIAAKLNATTTHLRKAATREFGSDSLWITFSSGTHVDSTPPTTPETMALGTGDAITAGQGVNQQLVPVLRELRGSRLGIVVMDFFETPPELIDLVLRP